MKRILLSILMIGLAVNAFAADITKNIKASGFNGINISSIYDVTVNKSDRYKVVITVSEELEKYIEIDVKMNTLYLSIDSNNLPKYIRKHFGDYTLKANISMPSLERLKASGACTFDTDDVFEVVDFKGDFSGAASIKNLEIVGHEADIEMSGAVNANIYGKLKDASYDISGAADVRLEQDVVSLDLEVSGASNVKCKGIYDDIEVSCSGASKVVFKGKANTIEADCSGASDVDAEYLEAIYGDAEASGASSIDINVKEGLTVELSGASTINYYSPANVHPNVKSSSRGSSLNRR